MSGIAPDERRLLEMLGLAARARKLVAGTASVRQGVREGKVALVLTGTDTSSTQLAKLLPLLVARGVRHHAVATRAALGTAIGRAPVGAVGVTDTNMARGIAQLAGALQAPRD